MGYQLVPNWGWCGSARTISTFLKLPLHVLRLPLCPPYTYDLHAFRALHEFTQGSQPHFVNNAGGSSEGIDRKVSFTQEKNARQLDTGVAEVEFLGGFRGEFLLHSRQTVPAQRSAANVRERTPLLSAKHDISEHRAVDQSISST